MTFSSTGTPPQAISRPPAARKAPGRPGPPSVEAFARHPAQTADATKVLGWSDPGTITVQPLPIRSEDRTGTDGPVRNVKPPPVTVVPGGHWTVATESPSVFVGTG
ncbi:hypothetical protein ACIP98_37430 [Streptomyces sp. NPDC088354]|uniref:hypothetical protein n=1 Tax=Streptomyces sp. NPDC088354 TaxID=3365856 RepID=UPI0037F457CD